MSEVRRSAASTPPASSLFERAADGLSLTARTTATALRVTRTIADLAGHDIITAPHVAEAIQTSTVAGM